MKVEEERFGIRICCIIERGVIKKREMVETHDGEVIDLGGFMVLVV